MKGQTEDKLSCSACGKPEDDVRVLAGIGCCRICDTCILAAYEVVRRKVGIHMSPACAENERLFGGLEFPVGQEPFGAFIPPETILVEYCDGGMLQAIVRGANLTEQYLELFVGNDVRVFGEIVHYIWFTNETADWRIVTNEQIIPCTVRFASRRLNASLLELEDRGRTRHFCVVYPR